MFRDLSEKLESIFTRLRNRGRISEKDLEETMREVRRALLEADVNYKVVKEFVSRVEKKARDAEITRSFTPAQQIVKIVHEELTRVLGTAAVPFKLKEPFSRVMVVGLQGSGKTTFCAKLALFLKKQGRKPLLAALDVYRPAAGEQLAVLAASVGAPFFGGESADAGRLYEGAVDRARELMCDTVIMDTAGRLHIDEQMMHELEILRDLSSPEEILLVLDSMTGQEAVSVAKSFKRRLGISGMVLTKLDGDARGGAALSVSAVTGEKIRFGGTGERVEDLEIFHPDRLAGRILGMGDVLSLVEKAGETIDADEAAVLQKKLKDRTFTLDDFLKELGRLRKMGPVENILELIPGIPKKALKGMRIDERQFVEAEAIINSMTKQERAKPQIIDGSRRKRIARGSGTTVQSVNNLLKQFNEMKKMMKQIGKGRMRMPFMPG